MQMESAHRRARRDRIMALAAGALVLGVGGSLTLAAWSDAEWAFGGVDGGTGADTPGLGTSVFEVQQDASAPFTAVWGDFESNPGDALTFTLGSLALTPGDVVYAPVALSTTANSIAGTLQLQPAVAATGVTTADAGGLLWNSLVVSVAAATATSANDTTTEPTCTDELSYTTKYTEFVTDVVGLGGAFTAPVQSLAAAHGNAVHYCFRIELPTGSSNDLQGRTAAPAWQFVATSS